MNGKVYLVGAGPGDPGLITVRGAACLRCADTVVYDRLVAPELLSYAPEHAERIYAGKAASDHTLSQTEINRLLVERAAAGRCVVRLKGGDPFVFGRGGEEALALAEAGIRFEVVPGVSSSIAGPAYAGIPLTHRGVAASFTVRTGHRAPNVDRAGAPGAKKAAASPDTVVYLMGVENLHTIVAELLAEGHAADTPAALIRWGTTPRQETVTGRLDDIVERGCDVGPPALLVVGRVVALRERLNWFDGRPLTGKRILITRACKQPSELVALLEEEGAETIEFPTMATEPWAGATAQVDRRAAEIAALLAAGEIDAIPFTSSATVRGFVAALGLQPGDQSPAWRWPCVACIGPLTAQTALAEGAPVNVIAETCTLPGLVAALKSHFAVPKEL